METKVTLGTFRNTKKEKENLESCSMSMSTWDSLSNVCRQRRFVFYWDWYYIYYLLYTIEYRQYNIFLYIQMQRKKSCWNWKIMNIWYRFDDDSKFSSCQSNSKDGIFYLFCSSDNGMLPTCSKSPLFEYIFLFLKKIPTPTTTKMTAQIAAIMT